jgi:hypothetical protein
MTNIARPHSVERTSPKGEPLLGGKTRLGASEVLERCENPRGMTYHEAMQRERLKVRLASRPRPTRDDFQDVGAPMLNEKALF